MANTGIDSINNTGAGLQMPPSRAARIPVGNQLTLDDELDRQAITLQTWGGADILHRDMDTCLSTSLSPACERSRKMSAGVIARVRPETDLGGSTRNPERR